MSARSLVLLAVCAGPAAATDPAYFVQPSGAPTFVAACPGCPPREASSFGSLPGRPIGTLERLTYPFLIGEGCRMPVGCSSLLAERTFIFGSCRQFYTPGNKCSLFPGGFPCGRGAYGYGGCGF